MRKLRCAHSIRTQIFITPTVKKNDENVWVYDSICLGVYESSMLVTGRLKPTHTHKYFHQLGIHNEKNFNENWGHNWSNFSAWRV